MSERGTVTNVFTSGYVEVAVWEDGQPGARREVAEVDYKRPRRDDVVELVPAQPRNDRIARIVYIGPVIFFIFGALITKNYDMTQRLLTGGILAAMTFVMAWLMNRPARLRRRLSWRVSRVIKKADFLN
jgi:positive regulator of sigma E activity